MKHFWIYAGESVTTLIVLVCLLFPLDPLIPLYCKPKDNDKNERRLLLYYCTSNGTQFFELEILHSSYFTLKVCMHIEIAKP